MSTFDFDFSLLKFTTPLAFDNSSTSAPIALPNENDVLQPGTICVVSGWGITEANDVPKDLRAVGVAITNQSDCIRSYSKMSFSITDRMICAADPKPLGDTNNRDACSGDSVI